MIGVLLVTHGNIGISLLEAANNITGCLSQVKALSLRPGEGMQGLRDRIEHALTELEEGSGVLVLVDIQGGTPGNVSLTLVQSHNIEILSGANLPMLISLLSARNNCDLKTLVEKVSQKGQGGIANLRKEWQKYHESCTD